MCHIRRERERVPVTCEYFSKFRIIWPIWSSKFELKYRYLPVWIVFLWKVTCLSVSAIQHVVTLCGLKHQFYLTIFWKAFFFVFEKSKIIFFFQFFFIIYFHVSGYKFSFWGYSNWILFWMNPSSRMISI